MITLHEPTDDVAAVGVVMHIEWSNDHDLTVFADVSRGPRGLTITRMVLRPSPSGSGVTRKSLRAVPLAELLNVARAATATSLPIPERARIQDQVPGAVLRVRLTDDLLRTVALAYVAETVPGAPRGAMRRMAELFNRPEGTMRTWIARARRDGWLAPGAKGRAAAEPGPRLLADDTPVTERAS